MSNPELAKSNPETETKKTKVYEVTLTKTATFEACVEIEAESMDEAERLATEQAEQGEHDEAFHDNLQEENIEVTNSECLDEDED